MKFGSVPVKVRSTELMAAYLTKALKVEPLKALQTLRIRPGCVTWSRQPTQRPMRLGGGTFPAPLEAFERLSGTTFAGDEMTANEARGPITVERLEHLG